MNSPEGAIAGCKSCLHERSRAVPVLDAQPIGQASAPCGAADFAKMAALWTDGAGCRFRAVYLMFDAGYHGSVTPEVVRFDIAAEAIRLAGFSLNRAPGRAPRCAATGKDVGRRPRAA